MGPTAVIALTFADGTVGRMQYHANDTSDAAIQAAISKSRFAPGIPTSWRRVTLADFPADEAFRNAWTLIGDRIIHDMVKARDILRDRLRAERAPLLAALDVEMMRETEPGPGNGDVLVVDLGEGQIRINNIVAEKQKLRDITDHPAIEAAATVDDLKALTLEALTKD